MKDWKVNLIVRGARFFFPILARRKMANASPEKRERLQTMVVKMEGMQHDLDALLETIHAEKIPRGTKIQEAMLEFNRKYAPDLVEDAERHLETIRAMDAESEHLKALREEAGEDAPLQVSLMQGYCEGNPESWLGRSYLVGALQKTGQLDEALDLARREPIGEFHRPSSHHRCIADLLLKKQDWDGAIIEARLAIQKAEEENRERGRRERLPNLPANMTLAEALLGKGERRKAKRIYQDCVRYSETDELKKIVRERIEKLGL